MNISDKKITVIGDFFENIDLSNFGDYNPSLILSSHTLEHLENPRQFIQLLFEHFNEKSVFIFQFPGFETLVDNYRFDQVFHQHLQYFSLKSIIFLLNELEGELIDFRVNPHHWGSLMVAFKKKSKKQSGNQNEKFLPLCRSFDPEDIRTHYEMFKCQMNFVSQHLTSIYGEKIYGYGAALMLPILAYHLDNDLSCLEGVIDDDVSKHGMYYINLPVKICPMPGLEEIQKSVMLITAVDNTSIILPKALSLNPAKIILPFNSIC